MRRGRGRPPRRGRDARSRPSSLPDPGSMSRPARAGVSLSSSAFGHHQIVAMNDLIATTVAEDAGNFTTLVAANTPDIGARIGREAAPGLDPGARADNDGVAPLEDAFDRDDAGGQKALAAPQRVGRPVVDGQCAPWVDRT